MQLSPLETTLLAGFVSLVTWIFVRMVMGRNYVTKNHCDNKSDQERRERERVAQDLEKTRQVFESKIEKLKEDQNEDMEDFRNQFLEMFKKIEDKQDLQFRMIRGLVTYSDIPNEAKEKILNER